MSELKAIRSGEIYNIIEYEDCFRTDDLYYPKYEADKVIVRNKYKRCSAMAKWCKLKRYDAADYRIPRRKWDFYDKWLKRWLAIAEKFKPNSTAQ